MKGVLAKLGKLGLLVGIVGMVLSAVALWIVLADHGPADYKKLQHGMHISQATNILGANDLYDDEENAEIQFDTEPSLLLPSRTVELVFQRGRLTHKAIRPPTWEQLLNHWKRQLGF